ncbi:helix-turn-helix domain-containing protein [Bacillus cereus]|nr:helix-turn-helix transcriptional regulator [Bacillus cereus]WJE23251.1 helix-turn-helix transcriptional regulator [Bacillus cereus]
MHYLFTHEKVKRIDFDTIDKLCDLFNCSVGEFLERR